MELRVLSETDLSLLKKTEGLMLLWVHKKHCGPCITMRPKIEKLAMELGDKTSAFALDANEFPAALKFLGIRGVPTTFIFYNGEEIIRFVGDVTKEQMIKELRENGIEL
ncbi:MAG: thioredoxin family protein [Patescibacteria group bacterium]|nr:thioredoxin family protein [Patescibacteria group bacterium]